MMTTTELRDLLASTGVDPGDITAMLAKAVETGKAVDDSVSDEDILEKAEAAAAAALLAEFEIDEDGPSLFGDDVDPDALFKGGADILALAKAVGDGADAALSAIFKSSADLSGAQRETSEAVLMLAKAVVTQRADALAYQTEVNRRLDAISKALSVPVPPRAVSGNVEPAASPHEPSAQTGGLDYSGASKHVLELQKAAHSKGDMQRVHELAAAARDLDNAADIATTFANFNVPTPSRA